MFDSTPDRIQIEVLRVFQARYPDRLLVVRDLSFTIQDSLTDLRRATNEWESFPDDALPPYVTMLIALWISGVLGYSEQIPEGLILHSKSVRGAMDQYVPEGFDLVLEDAVCTRMNQLAQ